MAIFDGVTLRSIKGENFPSNVKRVIEQSFRTFRVFFRSFALLDSYFFTFL